MHREIVLSATYEQSSRFDSRGMTTDPGNALLWRMNRRRLDVEAWRDAMLAVADRLDPAIGGPSVSLDAPSNCRRTLYAAVSRHDLASMLRLFDFPDPNITSGARVETTVPLQQLFVLNSEFMIRSADAVSSRLQAGAAAGQNDADRIRRAYLLLYGRGVTERGAQSGVGLSAIARKRGRNFARPQDSPSRWQRYTQALLAANEFAFID